jgi:hypothetical protein
MVQSKTHMTKSEAEAAKPQLSFCDIIHDNASSLIEKMQSLLPINMEVYSDFYMECLNSFQDLFGSCYIAEREIEQTIGIDQKFLQYLETSVRSYTKMIYSQIEIANNFQKACLQTSMSTVKTSDEYIRLMLDSYSRMVSNSLYLISKKS